MTEAVIKIPHSLLCTYTNLKLPAIWRRSRWRMYVAEKVDAGLWILAWLGAQDEAIREENRMRWIQEALVKLKLPVRVIAWLYWEVREIERMLAYTVLTGRKELGWWDVVKIDAVLRLVLWKVRS